MKGTRRYKTILIILAISLPLIAFFHLVSGQIPVTVKDVWDSLFAYNDQSVEQVIAREIRIPRMTTALLAGGSLALSGLLMQTLFRNPLAGPYVLGINSGASLFVALTIMTGIPFFLSDYGIIINALLGAFLFGALIMGFARFVQSQVSLLLIGIMAGSFIGAFISILQTLSSATELKVFTLWNLGSLQKVTLHELPIITVVIVAGVLLSMTLIRPLNILVIGEREAAQSGIQVKWVRYQIIAVTALLTGTITAYCGPIAFVGIAIPNVIRMIFRTQQHHILIIATFLMGSIFLIGVDILIQVLESRIMIPINAITSLIGAPIVVFIIFKRLR